MNPASGNVQPPSRRNYPRPSSLLNTNLGKPQLPNSIQKEGCTSAILNYKGKTLILVGCFHEKHQLHNQKTLNDHKKWITEHIKNENTPTTGFFLEIPRMLESQIGLESDCREKNGEMYIAAKEIRKHHLSLHALEPEDTTDALLTKMSTWDTHLDKGSDPPTIKELELKRVLKVFREASLLFTGRPPQDDQIIPDTLTLLPHTIASKYKDALETLQKNRSSDPVTKKRIIQQYSTLLKELQFPDYYCDQHHLAKHVFSHISQAFCDIRDEHFLETMVKSKYQRCVAVVGSGHVETIQKLIKSKN